MTGVDAKSDLLGLVKHSASMELEYFGPVFGRPLDVPPPWLANDADPNADIVRELIDGAAGLLEGSDNLPSADQRWWRYYSDQLDQAARGAAGQLPG